MQNLIQNMMTIELLLKNKYDFFHNKLNMLAIHEELSKLDLINTQMEFDAAGL